MREVAYHLKLLMDVGFIDAAGDGTILRGLTWEGHEFLDNVKSDDIWAKVKAQASTLPGIGLRMIATIAESEIKRHLGLV
jgi:hypothetical protein